LTVHILQFYNTFNKAFTQGDSVDFIKANWPLILLISWFGYRWWTTIRVKKMLPSLKKAGAYLVDVRSQGEFQSGCASASINIPLSELSQRLGELDQGRPVVVACASGMRSARAKAILKRNGFRQVYNVGSWTNF
jgi:phage shock protein E